MDIQHKLNTLKKIAYILNSLNAHWAVGASLMLYLRGMISYFNDIDIMIDENDVSTAIPELSKIGELIISPANNNYKTKHLVQLIESFLLDK